MADKTKSIKECTDEELDGLIKRLRKESEAQSIISDIKRKTSDGYVPYDQGQGVSTEQPVEGLYHVGILGMRWGHKKSGGWAHPNNQPHSESTSDDHIKKATLSAKKMHELSNAELKAFNERMNLEKQYKEFTKKRKGPVDKLVTEILGTAAKQTAATYTAKYMAKSVEALIKKTAKP